MSRTPAPEARALGTTLAEMFAEVERELKPPEYLRPGHHAPTKASPAGINSPYQGLFPATDQRELLFIGNWVNKAATSPNVQ